MRTYRMFANRCGVSLLLQLINYDTRAKSQIGHVACGSHWWRSLLQMDGPPYLSLALPYLRNAICNLLQT